MSGVRGPSTMTRSMARTTSAAAELVRAIERVIVEGPRTPDMKGKASTAEVGAAVAEAVRSASPVAV